MGSGSSDIIKTVAPLALQALEIAAESLLAGPVYATKRRPPVVGDPLTTMVQDLQSYVESNFAANYGYYYAGATSSPTPVVSGKTLHVYSGYEDIVVWDPNGDLTNIQQYLQTVLAGSLPVPGDAISIADNLSQIFTARFQEESLEWTPLPKRYNQSSGLIADTYMETACAKDVNTDLCGIVYYCFVAYAWT